VLPSQDLSRETVLRTGERASLKSLGIEALQGRLLAGDLVQPHLDQPLLDLLGAEARLGQAMGEQGTSRES
jgi:hypothetical protein